MEPQAAGVCDEVVTQREKPLSELFEYLQQIVFEVETGRLSAADVRRRLFADWGGVRVRGYMPKRDPQERETVRELIRSGIPERSARMKVKGK
jgi:hypothetical protein